MEWPPAIHNYMIEEGKVEISTCPLNNLISQAKKKANVSVKLYLWLGNHVIICACVIIFCI